ncbi:MAG: hypothetical protein QM742_08240 [Aquabacterium sp.]
MSDIEWGQRCADRLQQQWPRASLEDLEDTAVTWLRLGVLVHQTDAEPKT